MKSINANIVLLGCALLQLAVAFTPALNQRHAIRNGIQRNVAPIRSGKDDSSDKLVYDLKANRFFEADITNNDSDEGEFCLIDTNTKEKILLTREEKERIFLDSIQSYYFSGKSTLNDKDFDRLRNDLSWEGSALVTLNRNETLFMNAIVEYNRGTPIISDKEFDELKIALRESNSKIAVSTEPKCYVDTGVCKVNWVPDTIRTTSLYVPAALIFTTLYLGIFYEIPFIRSFFNPLLLLAVGAVPIYQASRKVTEEFFFKSPAVASGPCPSCGVENHIFFGDVLGVEGDAQESTLKCTNCKTSLTVKRSTLRVSTLVSDKAPGPPAKAVVKAAA